MADRNKLIIKVKSARNFERAKLRFEFCGLMCGLELEVAEAYVGKNCGELLGRTR